MLYYLQQLSMLRILYRLVYWTMLSTNYRNKVIDICCRIVSTDGEVTLEERIWLHKLCDHNKHAKEIMCGIISEDKID